MIRTSGSSDTWVASLKQGPSLPFPITALTKAAFENSLLKGRGFQATVLFFFSQGHLLPPGCTLGYTLTRNSVYSVEQMDQKFPG